VAKDSDHPMKSLLYFFCFLMSLSCFGQQQLNQYKYVVIPKTFDGFKKANQYKTSTLVKYMFTQRGFNTLYDDALPQDLNANKCLGLWAGFNKSSSLFATKVTISLKDCNGVEVYRTTEGISKEKEYDKAYSEGIKKAFVSLNGFNYAYTPKKTSKESMVDKPEEVIPTPVKLEEDEVEPNVAASQEIEREIPKAQPKIVEEVPAPKVTKTLPKTPEINTWYAQEITNGYQLVDNTPKIRLRMYKSSVPNVYHATGDAKTGIVYQKDGAWIFEYQNNGDLIKEKLNLKF